MTKLASRSRIALLVSEFTIGLSHAGTRPAFTSA